MSCQLSPKAQPTSSVASQGKSMGNTNGTASSTLLRFRKPSLSDPHTQMSGENIERQQQAGPLCRCPTPPEPKTLVRVSSCSPIGIVILRPHPPILSNKQIFAACLLASNDCASLIYRRSHMPVPPMDTSAEGLAAAFGRLHVGGGEEASDAVRKALAVLHDRYGLACRLHSPSQTPAAATRAGPAAHLPTQ